MPEMKPNSAWARDGLMSKTVTPGGKITKLGKGDLGPWKPARSVPNTIADFQGGPLNGTPGTRYTSRIKTKETQ